MLTTRRQHHDHRLLAQPAARLPRPCAQTRRLQRGRHQGGDDSGGDDSGRRHQRTKDGGECDGSELIFSAHGLDGGDNEITGTFVAGTMVKGLGRVTNPCDIDLSFTTNDSCLVKVWRVLQEGAVKAELGQSCDDAITEWTVPANGVVEEITLLSDRHTFTAGTWTLEAELNIGNNKPQAEITAVAE
jgi:hypothetical protein